MENIIKTDICAGNENSGLNTLFLFPQSIEFAKFYKKIIFLDPIIDLSYVAKINQISSAEIFVLAISPLRTTEKILGDFYFIFYQTMRGVLWKDASALAFPQRHRSQALNEES